MKETNDLWANALANLPGASAYSLDSRYRYINFTFSHKDDMKALLGADISVGSNMLEFIRDGDCRGKTREHCDRALGGEAFVAEEERRDGAGQIHSWRENRYSPIYDGGGSVAGVIVLSVDIAGRKQEDARQRHLAFIMDRISSAVISADMDFRITYWNKGAEALYGWGEAEALGRLVDDVCGTDFPAGQRDIARHTLLVEKNWRGELRQRRRDETNLWVDSSVTLLEDGRGKPTGTVAINHDVTDRKLAEDELRRTKESIEQINLTLRRAFEREQIASRTDSLTDTFNRRYFFELLEYEFSASRRYGRPLSLVMFDVDFLKKINDTFGHQAGDEALKKAAEAARMELRESDVLARYGGDEFAALLSNSGEQEAFAVLERIYSRIQSAHILVGGKKIGLSISAGIACMQSEVDTPDQLVMRADKAMYVAKNSGRNRMSVFADDGGK